MLYLFGNLENSELLPYFQTKFESSNVILILLYLLGC